MSFSVSMAYFLGPLLGGEISQYIGFSWLMSIIGLANIFYGIYLMKTELLTRHSQVRNRNVFQVIENNYYKAFISSSFFLHRVSVTKIHRRTTTNSIFGCGHQIQRYRVIQATSDSTTRWISHSTRLWNEMWREPQQKTNVHQRKNQTHYMHAVCDANKILISWLIKQ